MGTKLNVRPSCNGSIWCDCARELRTTQLLTVQIEERLQKGASYTTVQSRADATLFATPENARVDQFLPKIGPESRLSPVAVYRL